MGEGQTEPSLTQNPAGPSPAGSLNGLGYARLDGTDLNPGKSDLSYVAPDGLGKASDLLATPDFFAAYRVYSDPLPTNRTLGFNIGVIAQTNLGPAVYSFSRIEDGAPNGARYTANVGPNTNFWLYGPGAPGGSGAYQPISAWLSDPYWAFLADSTVFRVGFNIGSWQRNNVQYVDWLRTSLLNGGELIDFVAAPIPEPAFFQMGALAGLSGLGLLRLRRRS